MSCARLAAEELENKHYFEGAKNWFTTCRNLGYLFVEKKDPANAEYWFLQALDHTAAYFDPSYAAECHLALGELYLKQGRIPDAQHAAYRGTDRHTQNQKRLQPAGRRRGHAKKPGSSRGLFFKGPGN